MFGFGKEKKWGKISAHVIQFAINEKNRVWQDEWIHRNTNLKKVHKIFKTFDVEIADVHRLQY